LKRNLSPNIAVVAGVDLCDETAHLAVLHHGFKRKIKDEIEAI
jgi:hypothetical protein